MNETKRPVAVVFVHGFTGGSSTWKNVGGEKFKDLLLTEDDLSDVFDMVEFEYFSKITDIFHADLVQKAMSLFGLRPKVRYNRPIKNLADELRSFIQLNLDEYEGVVLIGHSMGGLICKEVILSHVRGDGPEIIGYASIAVPHKGSLDSMLFALLNVNSKELVPLNAYNSDLNNRWVDKKSTLPESIYIIGQHDQYVPESSGLPFTCKFLNIPHDHNTICKPTSKADSAYKAVLKFLKKIAKNSKMAQLSLLTYAEASPDYDKEIFVIKMILCDIGEKGMEDAKESFFNAEIITKAADEDDRKMLLALRGKVISLYRQTFNYHESVGSTSNKIFAEVHEKLLSEDRHALDVGASYINFLHKKGLLHQEANKPCNTITWSNSTTLDEIKAMLK